MYGGDLPATVPDDLAVTPQTSYGTQKAMAELLINDYTRRGFVDGRSLQASDDQRPPGPAERRRIVVCERHHPRAAERRDRRCAR